MKISSASLAGAAVLALVLTSCGSAAAPRTVVGESTSTLAPLSPDAIVWQVVDGAGFTTVEYALSVEPTITVYADGRVIVPRPQGEVFDPTPVQMREGTLTAQQVEALRSEADSSGLFDGGHVDFGQGAVSDAGTTMVTAANASGEEVSVAAYALGFTGDVGVTAEQQRLRAELSRLVKNSLDQVPDTSRMDPTQLAVLGFDRGSSGDQPPAVAWPGTPHTKLFARQGDRPCVLLPADETAAVWAAALDNPGLRWRDADGPFTALVKIVLPGTQPCPV